MSFGRKQADVASLILSSFKNPKNTIRIFDFIDLRLLYTFRGVTRPSDVARPV